MRAKNEPKLNRINNLGEPTVSQKLPVPPSPPPEKDTYEPVSIEELKPGDVVCVISNSLLGLAAGDICVIGHAPFWVKRIDFVPKTARSIGGFTENTYRNVYRSSTSTVKRLVSGPTLTAARDIIESWRYLDYVFKVTPTLGADPEMFMETKGGDVIPAWKYLPLQKAVKKRGVSYAHADGVQGEICMGGTPDCGNYATDHIAQGMFALLQAARRYDPSANFSLRSVTILSEDLVTNATKAQLDLGCDPAANAYGELPLSVDNPESLPFRFAGGHVHLGLIFPDNETIPTPRKFNKKYTTTEELEKLVHTLDATVGVLFVAVMADLDSPIRRQYYGRAGEYRQKPYGLEYRVLSNAWLLHPVLTQFMFDMTRAGLAIFDNDIPIPSPLSSDRIRYIINTCDVEAAREYIFNNWIMWKCIAQKYYGVGVEDAFKLLVEEGAAALLPVDSGIKVRSNWHIVQTSPSMLSLQWDNHASSSNVRMGDFLSKLRTTRSLAAIK